MSDGGAMRDQDEQLFDADWLEGVRRDMVRFARLQLRDETLAEEARHLAQPGALALMAGDFNTTPWARGLFAVEGQLRRASGAVPSWPNAWGLLSVLPLDHVLTSNGWRLVEASRGPDLRSDHRPVVVRLAAP